MESPLKQGGYKDYFCDDTWAGGANYGCLTIMVKIMPVM